MSDCMVKHICQKWIDVGLADECFWEGWPECPTPQDGLTPRMVLDRIEELEAKLAKAVEEAEKYQRAFAAQSRKLQAVIHIDGVRTTLAAVAEPHKLTGGKDE